MKEKSNTMKTERKHNKEKEAKSRRLIARNWAWVATGTTYKKAASMEACRMATRKIEEELFDGIFLSLNERNSKKSYNVQKRILRRIVEKRMAQTTRKKVGRTAGMFANYQLRRSASKSMGDIRKLQNCTGW